MRLLCAPLALAALVGCSSPEAGHPFAPVTYAPQFDPTFTAAEVTAIQAGFAEWPRTTLFDFDVVRVTDADPHLDECPARVAAPGDTYLGYTFRSESTCIYIDGITTFPAPYLTTLTQVSAHEYGHQLGLAHYTGASASIMHAHTEDDAAFPQALDIADLPADRTDP